MNALVVLKTALLDLSRALGDQFPLVIGGGLELYLRQEDLRQAGTRTLFEQLPEPRATNDIDLFLRMSQLVDVQLIRQLQHQVERMGFIPVDEAKYFQWIRVDDQGRQVKLDFLCGPVGDFSGQLSVNKLPRVRPKAPKNTLRFHARHTEEALELDSRSIPISVEGHCSDGTPHSIHVHVPHPFTYLLMKLFAFDDRKHDVTKHVGRHHAMDLYRIVAMMTEGSFEEAIRLGVTHREDHRMHRARSVVAIQFGSRTALGLLRLREHVLYREDFPDQDFIEVLHEICGVAPSPRAPES